MTKISLLDVEVFDGRGMELHPRFCFEGSPGNILPAGTLTQLSIDGSGCTLIPGLIDAKVDIDASPEALPQFAACGVTTLIDSSSGTLDVRAMRTAVCGDPTSPDYLATGSAVGSVGATQSTLFPYRAVKAVTTPAEAESFVSETVESEDKVDYVKIIVDQPGLDSETLAAAVTAAHRHGKLAIGHASQSSAYRLALDAGFDIVTPVPYDQALDVEVVRAFAERGIGVIPTLSFLRRGLQKSGHAEESYRLAAAAVETLYRAGVPICGGTAANHERGVAVPFGTGLFEEMTLLAEAGMSNIDVLRAVTSVPAKLFGLNDRGALELGRRADLVLVDGNPLEGLHFIKKLRKVWIQGVEVDLLGDRMNITSSQG